MKAPICVNCRLQMRRKKTGVDVELMSKSDPYQIWSGDLFYCESCKALVVSGFGSAAVAEHWQKERYAKFLPGVLIRFWGSLKEKCEAYFR